MLENKECDAKLVKNLILLFDCVHLRYLRSMQIIEKTEVRAGLDSSLWCSAPFCYRKKRNVLLCLLLLLTSFVRAGLYGLFSPVEGGEARVVGQLSFGM